MPIAGLPHLNMYYELHGPAGAPPLVLLHGATETFQMGWSEQVPVLSQSYRVVGLDLRGHGRSNNPADRLDLRQMADDVGDLLDYLDLDNVHLLGFSGGASVALFFAVRHLEQLHSLMLVSNNMEPDEARTTLNFWSLERVRREDPGWWATVVEIHEQPVEKLLQWWADEDEERPNFSPADLAHVNVPTLVMGGDRDPIIPLQQTLKLYGALPNAYLCVLPGLGHGAPRRRPALFNQIVLDFLKYAATCKP